MIQINPTTRRFKECADGIPDSGWATASDRDAPSLVISMGLTEEVPQSITPYQLAQWMIDHDRPDFEAEILAAINAIPDEKTRAKALWGWQKASVIEYSNSLTVMLAGALGWDRDQIFREAALYL